MITAQKLWGAAARRGNHGDEFMRRLSKSVANWLTIESERGVTAIEYGLIASLIALAIIVALTLLGGNLAGLFNYIAGQVQAPGAGGGG
jgi:pilus assembly protein Flp/PilA